MSILEIIDKKRRGYTHTAEEIATLVRMACSGEAKDYQLSAWLMAVCINGLTLDETAWLTDALACSGRQLDFSALNGVVVDKHSTGGVGDKTTIALIPMLAAAGQEAGVKIAKLSGRGLGFTGGTIDKLEAIPGFRTSLPGEEFSDQLAAIGMALSSQTEDLAPADAILYALRDVTSTVDNIPLIAASVVSKKIAAGARVIVLDIKYGHGAFMKTLEEARELASVCREVGQRLGREVSTVISAMNQPLGLSIGHTLEIHETVDLLSGRGPGDLEVLCLTLGSVALKRAEALAGIDNPRPAEERLHDCLHNGAALSKFREWIAAQGGDTAFIEKPELLTAAQRVVEISALHSGYVTSLDAMQVAKAAKLAGAGRVVKNAPIRLAVGVRLCKKIGDSVTIGETLAQLHLDDPADTPDETGAMLALKNAFTVAESPIEAPALLDEIAL